MGENHLDVKVGTTPGRDGSSLPASWGAAPRTLRFSGEGAGPARRKRFGFSCGVRAASAGWLSGRLFRPARITGRPVRKNCGPGDSFSGSQPLFPESHRGDAPAALCSLKRRSTRLLIVLILLV